MWVYKITNIQNQKVYIGQTIRPIEQRFKRHINDALNNILDTHLARAIRKYGKDSFTIHIIDSATSQDELNQKEQYWIRYYDSVNTGYNETDAISKCGGNTCQSKTEEEMKVIRQKLSDSKKGAKILWHEKLSVQILLLMMLTFLIQLLVVLRLAELKMEKLQLQID